MSCIVGSLCFEDLGCKELNFKGSLFIELFFVEAVVEDSAVKYFIPKVSVFPTNPPWICSAGDGSS